MSNSSIWPIDMTLSDATTSDQSGLRSIIQTSWITGASPNCLVSYQGQSLCESHIFTEMQSVYSTAQDDCAVP